MPLGGETRIKSYLAPLTDQLQLTVDAWVHVYERPTPHQADDPDRMFRVTCPFWILALVGYFPSSGDIAITTLSKFLLFPLFP